MTGYGEAHRQANGLAIAVEVRSINSRYFKFSLRAGDAYPALETRIEPIIRQHIKRGTVQVTVRIDREPSPEDYRINDVVFTGYRQQLESLYDRMHVSESIRPDAILSLPGVIDERQIREGNMDADWPLLEPALQEAMQNLTSMRQTEGQAMADDLRANCRIIADYLTEIRERHPTVVDVYRDRLVDRLNRMLGELEVSVEATDVVREVGLFAERSDISEEIVRLQSHLSQFEDMIDGPDSVGRKLDFLVQEMFRETNTIGAKANDAEIARRVVEIKTSIERMREMIQNVE